MTQKAKDAVKGGCMMEDKQQVMEDTRLLQGFRWRRVGTVSELFHQPPRPRRLCVVFKNTNNGSFCWLNGMAKDNPWIQIKSNSRFP